VSAWRVVATLAGWVVFVGLCALWGLLVIPATLLLSRAWPRTREHFDRLTRAALRAYVGSLGFLRLRVEGRERRLRAARVLVANHQSWLDPVVLLGLEPRACGPARGYLYRVPVVRSVLGLLDFFPADSGENATFQAMQRAAAGLRARDGALLVFPEGTRSRSGEVGAFQRGAFRIALDHGLPIQPVAIAGLDRVLPPGRLIAQAPGRPLVRVRYLAPLEPPYGEGPRREVVRALSERVRSALIAELEELRRSDA
jgi:1-acyl-sn-glycerol-3-phosphate acyltransferase